MSGYKRATVTISEQEYRRLHESDMKRRFGGRKKARTEEPGTSPELMRALREMEQRQQQLEQALRESSQNASYMEQEDLEAILTQNTLYYEQLAAMVDATLSGGDEAFAELSESFSAQIQQQHEGYYRALETLTHRFETSRQEESDKGELSRDWLDRAIVLSNLIAEQFDHERFVPGRLPAILMSLDLARNNLAQGLPEACLQSTQQAFLQLSELHSELEQRTMEWQAEYELAHRTLREVISDLELNSRVSAFDLQGEELAEQVDVDYWSAGKHGQLLAGCRQILEILVQDSEHIPTEDLRRTHTDWLPEVSGRLEAIIYEARLNALNSQLRMNIAERALQALEAQGFTLSEAGYSENDMRSAFTAYLDNPDGSQITIQVLPREAGNQELSNELIVTTRHAEVKTQQEVYLQWQELHRSLRENNLNVSQPEVHHEAPAALPDQVAQPAEQNQSLMRAER